MKREKNYQNKKIHFTTTPVLLLNWIFFFRFFFVLFFAVMQSRKGGYRRSEARGEQNWIKTKFVIPRWGGEKGTNSLSPVNEGRNFYMHAWLMCLNCVPSAEWSGSKWPLLIHPRTPENLRRFFLISSPFIIVYCYYLHWSPSLLWTFSDELCESRAAGDCSS